jgi:dihydrofolate reductase
VLAQAAAAAGDKAVQVVGGVSVERQVLHAGLADELRLDVMPALLGSGLHFFQDDGLEHLQLEKIEVRGVGARTSLRFRIKTAREPTSRQLSSPRW